VIPEFTIQEVVESECDGVHESPADGPESGRGVQERVSLGRGLKVSYSVLSGNELDPDPEEAAALFQA
jgi:hypothetical protein